MCAPSALELVASATGSRSERVQELVKAMRKTGLVMEAVRLESMGLPRAREKVEARATGRVEVKAFELALAGKR